MYTDCVTLKELVFPFDQKGWWNQNKNVTHYAFTMPTYVVLQPEASMHFFSHQCIKWSIVHVPKANFKVQCCFTSTETARTVRDRESRMATSTFTQLLNSEPNCDTWSNNNNNVHLSCVHRRPERSHDTYPKHDTLYTRRAQSYQNNLHKVLYAGGKTETKPKNTPLNSNIIWKRRRNET